MTPEFINRICYNNPRLLSAEYCVLDCSLRLEVPEYQGPFLKPTTCNFLEKVRKRINQWFVISFFSFIYTIGFRYIYTIGFVNIIHVFQVYINKFNCITFYLQTHFEPFVTTAVRHSHANLLLTSVLKTCQVCLLFMKYNLYIYILLIFQ